MRIIGVRKILCSLVLVPVFLLSTDCSSSRLLSDVKAVKLVKDHYLFFRGREIIKAEVIERGEYIEEYKCYPIKFKIIFSGRRNNNKTFYFHKNRSGKVAVSEFINRE